jgi:hypothetical protein
MARRKWKWTEKQLDKLNKVTVILDELKEYKPLTLRQIYYQLVSIGHIENKVSEYGMLSNMLKWARLDGYISWSDVEDRVRAFHNLQGWQNKASFLNVALNSIINQYSRDLWQDQDRYVEVWIEKDALSSIFTNVCSGYGVSVVVCRGFSSVSFLNDFRVRLIKQDGKKPVMLYFGDLDPSGVEMLEAMETTLTDEMGINGVEFKRIALLKDDIFKHNLPNNPDALKRTDTRSKKHVEKYGDLAVELDALRPDVLTQKAKDAIENEIGNVNAFNSQVETYNREIKELTTLKSQFMELVR